MSEELQVTYSKLTTHRGNKRIWLEGKRLSSIGFNRHTKYSVVVNHETGKMVLRIDPNGVRVVSGRKRGEKETPILDLDNVEVTKFLGEAKRIRATFSKGRILIEQHHEDVNAQVREDRIIYNASVGKVTEGSACSGAGIFTAAMHEGLQEQGVVSTVDWLIDRDGSYLQVALDNNGAVTDDTQIFEATLEELEPELLSPVDILQFSLPCTGHSISGKSKNKIGRAEEHPTDATSVFGVMNIIKKSNPAIISSENVTEAQDSATYMLIKAELQRLGYVIYEAILDHTQAGSFEKRKRYWFLAISKGLDALASLGLDNLKIYPKQFDTLGQVLDPIPYGHKMWADNQYLKDKAIKDKEAGKGFANRQLLTEEAPSCGTIGRHYNKRRSTEPFVTRSDKKERLLTPVEHARVKGVPENFIKGVAATTAHQVLGQAGLWNNAKGIGLRIGEIINAATQSKLEVA